jgi:DNA-binding GntR family transcriptional regulator
MISKPTLEEVAASELRNRILTGQIPSGTRLVESFWSEEFGISRHSIRAAFQRLSDTGLANRSSYVGWSVAEFHEADLREIAEVRAALEGFAAGLAAKRKDRPDSALKTALEHLGQAIAANQDIDEADHAFHIAIVEASGNSRLIAQHRSISDQLAFAIRTANLTGDPKSQLQQQHAHMLELVLNGKAAPAERAFREHALAVLERKSS